MDEVTEIFMSLNALSKRVSATSPISEWGVSLPRTTTRKLLYKPPLTKFLLENGGDGSDPLRIQEFLWDNKTTAFKLEPGMLVKITTSGTST